MEIWYQVARLNQEKKKRNLPNSTVTRPGHIRIQSCSPSSDTDTTSHRFTTPYRRQRGTCKEKNQHETKPTKAEGDSATK
jgi:hypothetical protein